MLDNFKELSREVEICKFTEDKIVRGERVEGTKEEVKDFMIVVPITPKALRSLPEGSYTTQDMKFYSSEQSALQHEGTRYKSGDIFKFNGAQYKIKDVLDRRFDAGAVTYYGKEMEHEDN